MRSISVGHFNSNLVLLGFIILVLAIILEDTIVKSLSQRPRAEYSVPVRWIKNEPTMEEARRTASDAKPVPISHLTTKILRFVLR